jgi:hypothetical protein
MSDSLKATVIVSCLEFTISTNPVLELDDDELLLPELPRPPAVEVLLPDEPVLLEPVPVLDELPELPEVTESPGEMLSNETTVPLAGA